MPLEVVYLSLGTNLGDRDANLTNAIALLPGYGVRNLALSSVYETEPQDFTDQPWFLNQVVRGTTELSAPALLAAVRDVEARCGRIRENSIDKGPRVLDIDILLFGAQVIETSELEVPHPRMTERRFVLEPLLELAPQLRDPRTGKRYEDYLSDLQGQISRKLT